MLIKECLVSIRKTFKRFISILLIVLLGVGFYAGIKATSPDMLNSLDNYYDDMHVHDFELMSSLGITTEDVNYFKDKGYNVEPSYSVDTIIKTEEEYAVKVLSYDDESDIDNFVLKEGKLPTNSNECLIEYNEYTENYKIGDTITFDDDTFKNKEMTIVGIIESPLYISIERGSTTLLSGKIDYYMYVPESNFNLDYYTNMTILLNKDMSRFTSSYEDLIDSERDKLEEITAYLGKRRYDDIVNSAREELDKAKSEYNNRYNDAQAYLDNPYVPQITKDEIKKELDDALSKINEAEKEIKELEPAHWYILDLDMNAGFYQYEKDAERVSNVAKVFPLVFFVVAILVCLTTMTRMVEEERSQIGTLKSLGYSNKAIMFKYVLYALLATVFGSLIGVTIGFYVIPNVIFNMYKVMYTLPEFVSSFNILLTLQGTIIATLCTLLATIYACYKSLKEEPAQLLRPKAPKPGKRVFLEHIPFIWKRLKFNSKVTVRNIFRYKKKFLMTIIGISGCTGLILAGFGLKDCIVNMVPNQYGKIFNYQVSVTLKDDISLEDRNNAYEQINSLAGVNDSLKVQMEAVELINYDTNETIQLIVPFGDISNFITLQNRTTNKKYTLDSELIISEKLTKLLNIKIGDTVEFKSSDKEFSGNLGNITENYLYHYIYMDKALYDSDLYNTILLKTNDMSDKEEKELANKIKETGVVSSISFNSDSISIFDSTMENFSYVSLVLIVSAGMLAFVVLYNLESVNISERKRELASIKVLGFYDSEVYGYTSRETILLSLIGMVCGIPVGVVLTHFIIKTCELDMMMFDPTISLSSYIYALGITFVFMILVNITTYFVLKKIDMIESLKSVE